MSRYKVVVDTAVGPQEYVDVQAPDPRTNSLDYIVTVRRPDGELLMPPLVVTNPLDAQSVSTCLAQAMAREELLTYAYTHQAYLWMGNRWVNADHWMNALSLSLNSLIRTGRNQGKNSNCFYNQMFAVWRALRHNFMSLKPFGLCQGVPVQDKVVVIRPDGVLDIEEHSPANQNVHVLPVQAMDVIDEYIAYSKGERRDSILLKFLGSSLSEDQFTTIRLWFGFHLVMHRLGRQDKMLYMFGEGGNGKGVIAELLKALVTLDAVAALSLQNLETPAALELLVGKMAMIGTEGTPETDSEKLKSIVAWEPIVVNPKYRDPFELLPTCLVTQSSNKEPRFKDESEAMVRRVIALKMEYIPSEGDKVYDLCAKVLDKEYALLVAFSLSGAMEVIEAGSLQVPKSIEASSKLVVRPITPTDRFLQMLEYGQFEVADDELYAAYGLMCSKQRLNSLPKREFFVDLDKRFRQMGRQLMRRAKVTGYEAQFHISGHAKRELLVPQLLGASSTDLHFGFRIAEGPFGPPIGTPIPDWRRGIPIFDVSPTHLDSEDEYLAEASS